MGLGLRSSWLKSPGLKYGVEKSGVGMSCNRVNSIGYDKIGAVFILLAIAMSLSSIIMSVELLIKKVINKGG